MERRQRYISGRFVAFKQKIDDGNVVVCVMTSPSEKSVDMANRLTPGTNRLLTVFVVRRGRRRRPESGKKGLLFVRIGTHGAPGRAASGWGAIWRRKVRLRVRFWVRSRFACGVFANPIDPK